jgi:hypothetical protein
VVGGGDGRGGDLDGRVDRGHPSRGAGRHPCPPAPSRK